MNKVREARVAKGWTQAQLADRLGVTQQAVQRYETGARDLKASTLRALAEALDVTVAYLIGLTDEDPQSPAFVDVPLYGSIAAGEPLDMEDADVTHPVPADVHLLHPEAFLLRVEGESMNRILPNGCYALIDPCADIDLDGQPYAVCVDDRAATIKRVRRLAHGIELAPDSLDPTFHPQALVDGGDLGGDPSGVTDPNAPVPHTVTVIGRVVWHCLPAHWSY